MIKTVAETLLKTGDMCVVVKKGKKYVMVGVELGLTRDPMKAAAFDTDEQAIKLMDIARVDSRNDRVLGKSYDLVLLTKTEPGPECPKGEDK